MARPARLAAVVPFPVADLLPAVAIDGRPDASGRNPTGVRQGARLEVGGSGGASGRVHWAAAETLRATAITALHGKVGGGDEQGS